MQLFNKLFDGLTNGLVIIDHVQRRTGHRGAPPSRRRDTQTSQLLDLLLLPFRAELRSPESTGNQVIVGS